MREHPLSLYGTNAAPETRSDPKYRDAAQAPVATLLLHVNPIKRPGNGQSTDNKPNPSPTDVYQMKDRRHSFRPASRSPKMVFFEGTSS
jgi:hypothetical protein